MYEATVSIEKQNAHLLSYVKAQMDPIVSDVNGIAAEAEQRTRNYLSIACSDTYRFQVKRKLCDVAALAITLGYKNIFLRKLLNIGKGNFFQNVMVDTVCIFDNDCERQAVAKLLDADRPLCLDGYYNFRLASVKKKWQELSKLVADNFYVLSDSETVVEFLQYLLESTLSRVKTLSASLDGNSFVLYDTSGRVIEPICSLSPRRDAEEEVMLNLVYFKPQKIKLYHSVSPSDAFCEMADALFATEYIPIS